MLYVNMARLVLAKPGHVYRKAWPGLVCLSLTMLYYYRTHCFIIFTRTHSFDTARTVLYYLFLRLRLYRGSPSWLM